ncbi:MAG: hypothetical protein ACRD8O_23790 [Bryobacteraceae bacterium]
MRRWLLCGALAAVMFGEDLPRGQIIDDVKCAADPKQSYALYIPSNYSPDRTWSVIFGFDPRARGRVPVERFQAAAEKYGYIVAGSNNSRNASWEASVASIQAMSTDVVRRFPINEKRVYTAGMSGGARVAMWVALGSGQIAGVIAASAGYPDSRPRKSVNFAVFGAAGAEDFNYREMRQIDRALTTPHRVVIFEGGHVWLSSELAAEAIEWMEIQAMKAGRRPREAALIERIFEARSAEISSLKNDKEICVALESLAADFEGLKDVSSIAARAVALKKQKGVKDALKKERDDEQREDRLTMSLVTLGDELADPLKRAANLAQLRNHLTKLARQANAADDSSERRLSRRVLRGLIAGSIERSRDPDLKKLMDEIRASLR